MTVFIRLEQYQKTPQYTSIPDFSTLLIGFDPYGIVRTSSDEKNLASKLVRIDTNTQQVIATILGDSPIQINGVKKRKGESCILDRDQSVITAPDLSATVIASLPGTGALSALHGTVDERLGLLAELPLFTATHEQSKKKISIPLVPLHAYLFGGAPTDTLVLEGTEMSAITVTITEPAAPALCVRYAGPITALIRAKSSVRSNSHRIESESAVVTLPWSGTVGEWAIRVEKK